MQRAPVPLLGLFPASQEVVNFQPGLGKVKGTRIVLVAFRSVQAVASIGSPVSIALSLLGSCTNTHDAHSASVLTFIADGGVDGEMVTPLRVVLCESRDRDVFGVKG